MMPIESAEAPYAGLFLIDEAGLLLQRTRGCERDCEYREYPVAVVSMTFRIEISL